MNLYVSTPEIIKAFLFRTTTFLLQDIQDGPERMHQLWALKFQSLLTNRYLFVWLDWTLIFSSVFCFCFGLSWYLEHRNVILTHLSRHSMEIEMQEQYKEIYACRAKRSFSLCNKIIMSLLHSEDHIRRLRILDFRKMYM